LSQIYEGMFLLDNQVVRESWDDAKTTVTGTLAKYGAEVITSRRWDERRLAYPIECRLRATYLLTYYTIDGDAIPAMRRDFDLSERVLRYLMLSVDAVPEGEQELSEAENASDFSVPSPPADDAPDPEPEPEPKPEAESKPEAEAEGEAGTEAPTEGDAPAAEASDAPGTEDATGDAAGDAAGEAPAEAEAATETATEAASSGEAQAESTPPAEGAEESTTKEEA